MFLDWLLFSAVDTTTIVNYHDFFSGLTLNDWLFFTDTRNDRKKLFVNCLQQHVQEHFSNFHGISIYKNITNLLGRQSSTDSTWKQRLEKSRDNFAFVFVLLVFRKMLLQIFLSTSSWIVRVMYHHRCSRSAALNFSFVVVKLTQSQWFGCLERGTVEITSASKHKERKLHHWDCLLLWVVIKCHYQVAIAFPKVFSTHCYLNGCLHIK